MGDNKSTLYSKVLQELEEERDQLQKKKNFWEEAKEQWAYLQREEQSLLEEVAYLSQGTVSANHAQGQLTTFDEEARDIQRQFMTIDDTFESKEKDFGMKEEELTEAYYTAKKQEAEDDEI